MDKILDSKDSSLINDIIYFDDVSVKLFSSKVLTIISSSYFLDFKITNGSAFGVFSYNVVTKELYKEGTQYASSADASIGENEFIHRICIYCNSEIENTHIDVLEISGDDGVRNVILQCEVIDEEERFAVALANNKFYINDTFLNAFKDSEINEHFTDYKLLNEKRRELLLDLFSIKSFVGVYYGLINALKYFGYDDDVILKEFWTYFDSQLNDYVLSRHDIETDVSRLPKGFSKTNMFNITYKFNDINGVYGEDDLPELIDTFFNDYEALVKMSNLKLILETYFLPAHAIIVEIVGEHTSFYKSGIGYYIHNAVIHYYNTEVKKVYSSEIHEYHESRQVILWDIPQTAVVFNRYGMRLKQVFDFHSDDHVEVDPMRFYDDNFAYLKLSLNEDYNDFMVSMKIIVVDSKNREVLTIEPEDIDPTMYIGFLKNDQYNVKMFCIDKYNLIHVYELKFETFFIKHNFETFTVKNALNYIEPVKRTEFKSTKEAFEYFNYFKDATEHNLNVTEKKYSGLPILHAYDSFNGTSGMQDYWKYSAGQYPLLQDMLYALKPYRFVTDNLAYINGFGIDPEKYARIPKELYDSLNKGYVMVFHEIKNGENTIRGEINGKKGEFNFFGALFADPLSVENGVIRKLYLDKEQYTPYNNSLGIFKDFDCYCYWIMDALTKESKQYAVLLSQKPYDSVKDTFIFNDFQFKNLVSHSGAFGYGNVYDNMEIGQNIELRTSNNKLYYRRSDVFISDIDVLISEISQMFLQYDALSKFQVIKLDSKTFFINGDMSFTFRVGENLYFGGTLRDHLVNDLIKIDSGTDVMQYSIAFAKIDDTAKSRPYDITWRLYEESGNDRNLITESKDYFFHYLLLDKTSYSLELEYYDKPNIRDGDIEEMESFKNTITKSGVYLTKNNYFDTLYKKFVESQYKYR